MSRRTNFRITSREKAEIQRLNRNAKAKSTRISNKFGIDVGINFKKLKDFTSRKEINEYKAQLKRFTNRSNMNYQYVENKEGLVLTKAEINKIEREERRVNRIKAQERKKYKDKPFTSGGKPTTLTVGQRAEVMKDDKYNHMEPVKFTERLKTLRNRSEFEQFVENIEKSYSADFINKRNEKYRDSYKKAMFNIFGMDATSVISHVDNLHIEEFMEMYYEEDLANIGFIYDKVERDVKLQKIREVWGM